MAESLREVAGIISSGKGITQYRLIRDLSKHEREELDRDFNLAVYWTEGYAISILSKEEFNKIFPKTISSKEIKK